VVRFRDSARLLELRSCLLVDATGRASLLARRLGARRVFFDYLVSASIQVTNPGESGVWTESVSNGWWNLVAAAGTGTLSFFTLPSTMRSAVSRLNQVFSAVRHLKDVTSIPEVPVKPDVRPAGSSFTFPSGRKSLLCVGDAVSAFQPLSSAGIAKAFNDARLVRAMLEGNQQGYPSIKVREFDDYRRQLRSQYRLETRWDTAFWQSQREDLSAPVGA
jgi:2-polyprenyl-6-methoxyphenol hydroxylase-like FAD-dependent oxidoreductase